MKRKRSEKAKTTSKSLSYEEQYKLLFEAAKKHLMENFHLSEEDAICRAHQHTSEYLLFYEVGKRMDARQARAMKAAGHAYFNN